MRLRTKYVNVEIHVRKILVTNNVVVKIGSCLNDMTNKCTCHMRVLTLWIIVSLCFSFYVKFNW